MIEGIIGASADRVNGGARLPCEVALAGDRPRLLSAFLDTPPNQYYGAPGMETLDVHDDPYLRALRPLVESSLAC